MAQVAAAVVMVPLWDHGAEAAEVASSKQLEVEFNVTITADGGNKRNKVNKG